MYFLEKRTQGRLNAAVRDETMASAEAARILPVVQRVCAVTGFRRRVASLTVAAMAHSVAEVRRGGDVAGGTAGVRHPISWLDMFAELNSHREKLEKQFPE